MQEAQIEQAKAKKIGENTLELYTSKDMSCPRRLVFLTLLQGALREPGVLGALITT
jgi:hypothetical protein